MIEVAVGVVVQHSVQRSDRPVDLGALVNRAIVEAPLAPPEEPCLPLLPPASAAEPGTQEERVELHAKARVALRPRDRRLDRRAQLRRDDLIRIDVEDPLAARPLVGRLPHPPLASVGQRVEVAGVAARDLLGTIGAAAVHDHDLVGPRDALEHGVEEPLLVQSDDEDAELRLQLAHEGEAGRRVAVALAKGAVREMIVRSNEWGLHGSGGAKQLLRAPTRL